MSADKSTEPGIPLTLARQRRQTVSDLSYELSFSIPPEPDAPVIGRALLRFKLRDSSMPLVLDFRPTSDYIHSSSAPFTAEDGHILIAPAELTTGDNVIEIVFRTADASLHRTPNLVYTLFVPARAHFTFPCMDQPDLKARFTLDLTLPATWECISNAEELSREVAEGRARVRFAGTEPISTYLLAFAAAPFKVETAQRGGRRFRMFHLSDDEDRVARNRDVIFDLHALALDWLETYTGIPYPFGKFDFVLIPAFQFGGMEHPGCIYYREDSLLLDASATDVQAMNRASLIAHETAHMWFGDLVTMEWFDDVWLKEVFANLFAAKIVHPVFSDMDHELRFLVAHYPGAYAVDRTAGTHPIRQRLENLDQAGSLYGPIIYQKAPIVLRQLERLIGSEALQAGLQIYLRRFAFSNATWEDLVHAFQQVTTFDLSKWSHAWIDEEGRPSVHSQPELDAGGNVRAIILTQSDPKPGRCLQWPQQIEVLVGGASGDFFTPVAVLDSRTVAKCSVVSPDARFVLPPGRGLAYGDFALDAASRNYLLVNGWSVHDPASRGAIWITLWDEMLNGRLAPSEFMESALAGLPREGAEQIVQLVLGYVKEAFWRFHSEIERRRMALRLEQVLRDCMVAAESSSLKSTYYAAFRGVMTSADAIEVVTRIWRGDDVIAGLKTSESDDAAAALEIAVRSEEGAAILREQHRRFKSADRQREFEFLTPALSHKSDIRDAFFESLRFEKNRRREPWVVRAMTYLNHPMRAGDSLKYLRPALDLLPVIERTGDIFFPRNWLDALLSGHSSPSAANAVRAFLRDRVEFPPRLQRLILQSADNLFRAVDSGRADRSRVKK